MDELGPDEQKWLDALRADEPSTTDRARVRAHVLAGIAASAAGATTATVAGAAKSGAVVKAGAGAIVTTWKIGAIAVAVVLVGGVAGTLAFRSNESARSSPATVSAAATVAPPAVVDVPAAVSKESPAPAEAATVASPDEAPRTPAVTAPLASSRATTRSTTRSAARADDVDGELALLSQAQRALERGEPNMALGFVAQHAREHPRGALALEREGLRAIASCDAKRPDGRALADRYVAAHPTAPLVARVRAACLSP